MCEKTYRYRRVHIWLERHGIDHKPKTILRVMQKYNLLSVVRDLYDNSIVACKTGTEQNISLVLSTIREAKKREKVTAELQLHSDQGFQYTSHAYSKLTKPYNITQSMSRKGNPYDLLFYPKSKSIHRAKL